MQSAKKTGSIRHKALGFSKITLQFARLRQAKNKESIIVMDQLLKCHSNERDYRINKQNIHFNFLHKFTSIPPGSVYTGSTSIVPIRID